MKMFVAATACAAILAVTSLAAPLGAQAPRGGVLELGIGGPGSTIGVSVAELNSEQAAKAKADSGGVVVERVQDGTPAARAGIKQGDIVVEFDGERVRSTRQFMRLVQETPPNRAVRVIVVRDGSRQTMNVTPELGRLIVEPSTETNAFRFTPQTPFAPGNTPDTLLRFIRPQGRLGVSISPMGDQLAAYFGVKQGVLVESVEADSAASTAGLKAGDVIIEVAGRAITQASQVTEALAAAQPGSSVDLKIVRDKKELTLKAAVPERAPTRLRTIEPIGRRNVI